MAATRDDPMDACTEPGITVTQAPLDDKEQHTAKTVHIWIEDGTLVLLANYDTL
jgi:hypothetical protein